ncbi:hypothetical protein Tco_0774073 [Tanacetum coccineum]|uniref:Uncharacterized protein n=1 Tax=Tanacetum coccineum TaxID=301880 RepID=A0ABQ4ZR72_9ASTR
MKIKLSVSREGSVDKSHEMLLNATSSRKDLESERFEFGATSSSSKVSGSFRRASLKEVKGVLQMLLLLFGFQPSQMLWLLFAFHPSTDVVALIWIQPFLDLVIFSDLVIAFSDILSPSIALIPSILAASFVVP